MNSIRLKTSYADEKLPVGASKLFGTPDINDGFEWPTIEVDAEIAEKAVKPIDKMLEISKNMKSAMASK